MRISDWSSDVCSSDLLAQKRFPVPACAVAFHGFLAGSHRELHHVFQRMTAPVAFGDFPQRLAELCGLRGELGVGGDRPEAHTSELQSLMPISYAVFVLQKTINKKNEQHNEQKST